METTEMQIVTKSRKVFLRKLYLKQLKNDLHER